MLLLELVVHDPFHEAGFSDSGITYNNQLEQVVLGGESFVPNHFEGHRHQRIYLCLLH